MELPYLNGFLSYIILLFIMNVLDIFWYLMIHLGILTVDSPLYISSFNASDIKDISWI